MKSTSKFSPIVYREILSTIERICIAGNPDEKIEPMNDIYKIAHAFSGKCKNPHPDWRESVEIIGKQLDEIVLGDLKIKS